jgi:vitamin B12 transporter
MTPLRSRVRAAAALSCTLLCVVHARASAQRPGTIEGTIVDAATSLAVEGADIVLPGVHRTATSGTDGRFTIRGLEPGEWTLHVSRLGFLERTAVAAVRNGETTRLTIVLAPAPLTLTGVDTRAQASSSGAVRIDRTALERTGARTAGDALRDVAGVVVRSSGPGSPQTVSLRGMAADAVLVLVDGVPLNDPVTGEADLSTIDVATIASITVLPGGQSARWGPRAAAGIITIERRHGGFAQRSLALGAGSLGGWDAALAWGGGWTSSWSAGVSARGQDGMFDFELPAEVGGGARRRSNADVRALDAHAAAGAAVAGGTLDARAGYDVLERGVPGRGFAPSRFARQASDRARASATWRRGDAASALTVLLAGTNQRIVNTDTLPPFGLPYDDTTRALYLEARIDGERSFADARAGGGVAVRRRHIGGTVLAADAPATQVDAGVHAHGELPLFPLGAARLRLGVQLRADRDAIDDDIVPSHSVTLGWAHGGVALHASHRSSYSPPAAGDLYFRDALGIEPNPDLRAERVPGEVEVGASVHFEAARWPTALRAAAYRGDIDGMILWAPDYRFVWSPINQDARRTGAEATADLASPGGVARLAASYTFVRATYDRGADDDDVQIAYRPRHTASVRATLALGAIQLEGTTRYTGRRTTAPTELNTLPGFWTVDAGVSYERAVAGWNVAAALHVDRVLDGDDTLIFGFPEPGRVARFGVRLSPDSSPIRH